eukprot:GHVS01088038.1.p1 GENE.GHVS01088038.1~~GHVS01088038.1.p1  ORF type:complete len:349 (+),score=70.25 GHVS01088038.1:445-1491(+)
METRGRRRQQPAAAAAVVPKQQRKGKKKRPLSDGEESVVQVFERDKTTDMEEEMEEEEEKEAENKQPVDPVDIAMKRLQLNALPDVLPCREKEFRDVYDFLLSAIQGGSTGQVLFISGVPGTGKTATALSALRKAKLTAQKKEGGLAPFEEVHVNAFELAHPDCVYQDIYRQVFHSKGGSSSRCYEALDQWIEGGKKSTKGRKRSSRPVTVALIDEIDILLTKTQNVLYTLLNWPHKHDSKFVLMGISNMIDLPAKMLPRCKSRLGFAHVRFMPYSAEQIQAILEQRLHDCGSLSNALPIFHKPPLSLYVQSRAGAHTTRTTSHGQTDVNSKWRAPRVDRDEHSQDLA